MPAVIGNRTHAKIALEMAHADAKIRKGWKRLGRGASRVALLHIETDVVYKVQTWGGNADNESEYKNARECRKLQWDRVRIPKMSIFRFDPKDKRRKSKEAVIAMEHVRGRYGESIPPTHFKAARKELFEKGGFGDMHGLNFKVTADRKIVPIDMGSERHGKGWNGPDDRLLTCGGGRNW